MRVTIRDAVAENRRRLQAFLPSPPIWLEQVHGTTVAVLDGAAPAARIVADAAVTRTRGVVVAVQTADCLPVIFADRNGTAVGIAHAGWRGLAAGVLEATVSALQTLGVKRAGRRRLDRAGNRRARVRGRPRRPRRVLRARSRRRVRVRRGPSGEMEGGSCARWHARASAAAGVGTVTGGGFCTHDEPARFFSYRRAPLSGRMASLAWLADDTGRS